MTNPPDKLQTWRLRYRNGRQYVTVKARLAYDATRLAAAKLTRVHRKPVSPQDVVPWEEPERESEVEE